MVEWLVLGLLLLRGRTENKRPSPGVLPPHVGSWVSPRGNAPSVQDKLGAGLGVNAGDCSKREVEGVWGRPCDLQNEETSFFFLLFSAVSCVCCVLFFKKKLNLLE